MTLKLNGERRFLLLRFRPRTVLSLVRNPEYASNRLKTLLPVLSSRHQCLSHLNEQFVNSDTHWKRWRQLDSYWTIENNSSCGKCLSVSQICGAQTTELFNHGVPEIGTDLRCIISSSVRSSDHRIVRQIVSSNDRSSDRATDRQMAKSNDRSTDRQLERHIVKSGCRVGRSWNCGLGASRGAKRSCWTLFQRRLMFERWSLTAQKCIEKSVWLACGGRIRFFEESIVQPYCVFCGLYPQHLFVTEVVHSKQQWSGSSNWQSACLCPLGIPQLYQLYLRYKIWHHLVSIWTKISKKLTLCDAGIACMHLLWAGYQ